MTISVVVPTRNRRTSLLALLAELVPQAATLGADVVVVDNGSTDGTVEAVQALVPGSNGRLACVVEHTAGATRARNTGARAARGDVLAFVDDDALPHDDWLASLTSPFADGRIGAAGGRVRLRFATPRPAWLSERLTDYLAAYDLGPTPIDLGARPWYEAPRGLNMAVQRKLFCELGGFNLRLGPRADRPSVGEESDLCLRMLAHRAQVRYAPAAVVDHVVEPSRVAPDWFLRRAFWTGWSEGMLDLMHRGARKIAGRIRWHYRTWILRLPYRPSSDPNPVRLSAECERREAWGYVLSVARHAAVRRRLATG